MAAFLQFPHVSGKKERARGVFAPPPPALTKLPYAEARVAIIKICSIDDCGKPKKGLGLCSMHLWRLRHHGDVNYSRAPAPLPATCSADQCKSPPERGRKGMCGNHYRLWYRRGSTSAPRLRAEHGAPENWLRKHTAHDGQDCLIWPFARHTDGSAAIGSRYSRQAARLMCQLAHGDPPFATAQAAHSCGKGHRGCVNPQHLRWATPRENTNDKQAHGTQLKGSGHPSARLTELKVRAIRQLAKDFTVDDLVEIFDIHPWTLRQAIDRKTWAWLA